jgi:hypothetical protein
MELRRDLIFQIKSIIANSQDRAIRSVDFERGFMYWQIGKVIFEEEQSGKERAAYGTFVLKSRSADLQPIFGSGFSIRQLEMCRQFFRIFTITNAMRSQFSWTRYRNFIGIESEDKRAFYLAESEKNNWTARQLERQINSQLFEPLLLSNDVKSVIKVARNEKRPSEVKEIIKDPMLLELLGLKKKPPITKGILSRQLLQTYKSSF